MGSHQQTHIPLFMLKIVDHAEDDFTQKLRLPSYFIKCFNGIMPTESILKTSTFGRCWCIEVKTVEENMFFQKGWPDFVDDHSLEIGDSLVLEYIGNFEFDIKIFGKDGSKKELPLSKAFNDLENEVRHVGDSGHHKEPNLSKRCGSKEDNRNRSTYGTKPRCNRKRSTGSMSLSSEERPNARDKKKRSDYQGKSKMRKISEMDELNQASIYRSEESLPCQEGNERIRSNVQRSDNVEQKEANSVEQPDFSESDQERTEESLPCQRNENMRAKKYRSEDLPPCQGSEKTGSNVPVWINIDSDESSLGKRNSHSWSLRTKGNERVKQVASTFQSEHPFFTVFIRKSYLTYLHVPRWFAKRYFTKSHKAIRLLRGTDGDIKTWRVEYKIRSGSIQLGHGWTLFTREIGMEEGDVCVFELIKKEEAELKVSIFRFIADVLTLI